MSLAQTVLWSLLFGVSLAQPVWAAEQRPPEARPNVIILLADQWRASTTGYAGDPNVRTPNLDRLASTSLNFREAVTVCPVCTPARAALMTGRFPTTTGMFLNDAYLPAEELCLAEILAAQGYVTGYIGKWHLDGHGRRAFTPPERRQGWQFWKAVECEHDYLASHYFDGDSPEPKIWEGYDAYAQTRAARQWIRERAPTAKPFVLTLAWGVPHFPHATAPAEFQAWYPPESIHLPPNVAPAQQARAKAECQGYYAHCTALDRCIGDIVETLEVTGLARNTILIVTSDHGEMMGAHGLRPTMKQAYWNESVQVPFLLRWPALHGGAGRVVTTPITTTDVLPTILGLAGLPIPPQVEGEDLSPSLRSGKDDPDRGALFMNVAPFDQGKSLSPYRGIRTASHTYVRGISGPVALYDNRTDPWQMTNLVDEPAWATQRERLDRLLQARLERNRDDVPDAATAIARWGYRVRSDGSLPYSDAGTEGPQSPRRR